MLYTLVLLLQLPMIKEACGSSTVYGCGYNVPLYLSCPPNQVIASVTATVGYSQGCQTDCEACRIQCQTEAQFQGDCISYVSCNITVLGTTISDLPSLCFSRISNVAWAEFACEAVPMTQGPTTCKQEVTTGSSTKASASSTVTLQEVSNTAGSEAVTSYTVTLPEVSNTTTTQPPIDGSAIKWILVGVLVPVIVLLMVGGGVLGFIFIRRWRAKATLNIETSSSGASFTDDNSYTGDAVYQNENDTQCSEDPTVYSNDYEMYDMDRQPGDGQSEKNIAVTERKYRSNQQYFDDENLYETFEDLNLQKETQKQSRSRVKRPTEPPPPPPVSTSANKRVGKPEEPSADKKNNRNTELILNPTYIEWENDSIKEDVYENIGSIYSNC